MAKPTPTTFSEEFEPILVSAWGTAGNRLTDGQLDQTRRAAVELRHLYRFRDKPVTKIVYATNRYRAGYLAAFRQRHAYLSYEHLKQVKELSPISVPQPDRKGELTVTVLGAGAGVELYGLCLFYNEDSSSLKRLKVNFVEKITDWKPTRLTVMGQLLKGKFPKVNVFPTDLDLDLTAADGVQRMAHDYDALVESKILLIYNVLNEIEAKYSHRVWRNVDFLLRNCTGPLLVLLAEPIAPKARPRVTWFEETLSKNAKIVLFEKEAEIQFDHEPVKVQFERTGKGLNDRLFGKPGEDRPLLQTSITRSLMAAIREPHSPISYEQVQKQLLSLNVKRGKKGQFASRAHPEQTTLPGWVEPRLLISG